MKTLFNYLIEAKIDTEYEKSYSDIPRDIFNSLIMIDPKTTVVNNEPQGIGFVAKNLIVPAYRKGENILQDDTEKIKQTITAYYAGLSKYPKPNEFSTVADLLTFMENPTEQDNKAKTDAEKPVDPLTDIYTKYYSKIPREDFDAIIELDPGTTDQKIGNIAKNLFLPKYIAGETWILKSNATQDQVRAAANRFTDEITNYEREKQNLNSYETIKDFVEYRPFSRIAAEVPQLTAGTDYIYIASTPEFDVFKPLNFKASRDLAHVEGAQNVWCTAGGSSGHGYLNSDGISSYWIRYYDTYGKDIYEFINKQNPTTTANNFNLAIDRNSAEVYEFRDGANHQEFDSLKFFVSFLLKNPKLAYQLKASSDHIANCPQLETALLIINTATKPLIIKSNDELYKLLSFDGELIDSIKKVEIYNVDEILPQLFADWASLAEVKISGPKIIGFEAFKSCKNLTKLTLEAPLELIEEEAFANTGLTGSIWLPDTLRKVKEKAFYNTHCSLKVNKDRTTGLSFSSKDREWVNSHVKAINVQQSGRGN